MAALKIDFDRDILYEVSIERRPRGGVTMKKDATTNADVFMYKTEPGVYYSANGVRVSETLAARAGFDVERLRKEKEKIEKVKEFEAKYNAQLKSENRVVVRERGEYKLVRLPEDRYIVEDQEGNNLTKGVAANSLEQGLDWLTDFAGPEEAPINDGVLSAAGQGGSGTDRRSDKNLPINSDVGKSGRPKTAIPA